MHVCVHAHSHTRVHTFGAQVAESEEIGIATNIKLKMQTEQLKNISVDVATVQVLLCLQRFRCCYVCNGSGVVMFVRERACACFVSV
jgi:hypothetical protein